ncbi:MAG: hypothetical protein ABI847_03510, partial [Anaerolineales bacterium]
MITCVVCRNREQEGELYCSECGARLTGNWPGTGPNSATTTAYAASSRFREMPAAAAAPAGALKTGQITLTINGVPQPVILEGRTEYVLGREGHEQVIPDLNLNAYGARD